MFEKHDRLAWRLFRSSLLSVLLQVLGKVEVRLWHVYMTAYHDLSVHISDNDSKQPSWFYS